MRSRRLQKAQLLGFRHQTLTELWRGQTDEQLGALLHGLALEVHDAMLCHHIMGVHARVGHRARQFGHNARQAAALGGGMQGDEALAIARCIGAAHEVELPAGARELVPGNEL